MEKLDNNKLSREWSLMKNEIWKMFELTGNIDSYLYYKSDIDNESDIVKENYVREEDSMALE